MAHNMHNGLVVPSHDIGDALQCGLEGRFHNRPVDIERGLAAEAELDGIPVDAFKGYVLCPQLILERHLEFPCLLVHVVADSATGQATDDGPDDPVG